MKPLLISSGEPAGIGPDQCLTLAPLNLPIVIAGNKKLLTERAEQLGLRLNLVDYVENKPFSIQENQLQIISFPIADAVVAGQLNPANAPYVIDMLTQSTLRCLNKEFSALVTAPVQKSVINQAGIAFSGHTEFLASLSKVKSVVMMLACDAMRVALVTTHLPLSAVPAAIKKETVMQVLRQVHQTLQSDFAISKPRILVAGLNPHAGESGYLGREEILQIEPAIKTLQQQGLDIVGPLAADTMFCTGNANSADAFVCMYHDQGLAVLKYAGFGKAVNITLGLPFVRTSVDHGTALDIAGTGKADNRSLLAAIEIADFMAKQRNISHAN